MMGRDLDEVLGDLGLMPAQQGAQDKEAGRTSREAKAEAEKRKEVEKQEVEKRAGAEKRKEVDKKKKEADKKMAEKRTDIMERVTSPLLPDQGRVYIYSAQKCSFSLREKRTDIMERVASPLLPDKGRDACACVCVCVCVCVRARALRVSGEFVYDLCVCV